MVLIRPNMAPEGIGTGVTGAQHNSAADQDQHQEEETRKANDHFTPSLNIYLTPC